MRTSIKIKKLFLTAAVCLAGLSLSGYYINASDEGIEARLFKNVRILAEKGKIKQAKEDIQRVLRLNPRHAGATYFAGLYSFEEGNLQNAEKFFRRVENDKNFGAMARKLLAELRTDRSRRKYQETLNIYLAGESYGPALSLCEEVISQDPSNLPVIFTASYLAAMLRMQSRSEKFAELFNQKTKNRAEAAELLTFVEGWFTATTNPEFALEKLMSLSDKRLKTRPIRDQIKKIISDFKLLDKFEIFIEQEKKTSGADIGSLERELISFLIDQNQFEKALEMINKRPVDSIEDNILYMKILSLTANEKKAMSTARQLMSNAPQDLRLYQSWIEGWLKHVERTQNPPDGLDSGGKSFNEMADEILERLRPEKLVNLNPVLLMNMLRLAFMTSNDQQIKLISAETKRITYNDELASVLLQTADELIIFNQQHLAVDLLESARNQLPENLNLHIKLAEIHLADNPELSVGILESLLAEKPEHLRAFLLWADSMNLAGRGDEARQAILERLKDSSQSEIIRRQLMAKLEILEMQNIQDSTEENLQMEETEESY